MSKRPITDDAFVYDKRERALSAVHQRSADSIGRELIHLAARGADSYATLENIVKVGQPEGLPSCPACGGKSTYSVDDLTLACNACGEIFPDPIEQQTAAPSSQGLPACPQCNFAAPDEQWETDDATGEAQCPSCGWRAPVGEAEEVQAAAPPVTRQDPPGPQGGYPVPGEAIPGTGQPDVGQSIMAQAAQYECHGCGFVGGDADYMAGGSTSACPQCGNASFTKLPGAEKEAQEFREGPSGCDWCGEPNEEGVYVYSGAGDNNYLICKGCKDEYEASEAELGATALTEGHPDRAYASKHAQQNPMEAPPAAVPQIDEEPDAPAIAPNKSRTKEQWSSDGKFSREVEADSVDDLVRIHQELNTMGLTKAAPEQPQAADAVQQQAQAWSATDTSPIGTTAADEKNPPAAPRNTDPVDTGVSSTPGPIASRAFRALVEEYRRPFRAQSGVNKYWCPNCNKIVDGVRGGRGKYDTCPGCGTEDMKDYAQRCHYCEEYLTCPSHGYKTYYYSSRQARCPTCINPICPSCKRAQVPLNSPVAPENRQDEEELFEDTKNAQADDPAAIKILDECATSAGMNGPTHTGATLVQWRDDVNAIMRDSRPEISNQAGFMIADAVKAAQAGDTSTCESKLMEAMELYKSGSKIAQTVDKCSRCGQPVNEDNPSEDDDGMPLCDACEDREDYEEFGGSDPDRYARAIDRTLEKLAQPLGMPPAAAGMQFEKSNDRSDGDRVVWDIAWDPEMASVMSSENIKQNIRSFVLREVSNEKDIGHDHGTRNWGTIADPRVEDIDIDAGIATVSFQTSEQAAPQLAPAEATE